MDQNPDVVKSYLTTRHATRRLEERNTDAGTSRGLKEIAIPPRDRSSDDSDTELPVQRPRKNET